MKKEKRKADFKKAGNSKGTKFLTSKDHNTFIDLDKGLILFSN